MTNPYQLELDFTAAYRSRLAEHPAIREAACLAVLYPALFEDMQPGDLFAGRVNYRAVGFGLEQASGGPGYYCYDEDLRKDMDGRAVSAELRQVVEEMIAFWGKETTIPGRLIGSLPAEVLGATSNPVASMFGRLSGACIDFDKLLRLGLPGLRAEVSLSQKQAAAAGEPYQPLYTAMLKALDLLADVLHDYASRSRAAAGQPDVAPAWRAELETVAAILEKLVVAPPESLREAMQLGWLYALISGVVNYGRMDIYLGDFYAEDIDRGVIDEAEALRYLQSLWRLIVARKIYFNGRIVLGGRGRRNIANADRFALAAMEATRTVKETEPQLTLRLYQGMNPALKQKALEVIGEGRTYPMLYNDDINVPAVMHAFRVCEADAEHYYPYGCGEYALDHISFGSPNCGLNVLKALDVTLHNGVDSLTGKPLGLTTGQFTGFKDFDALYQAYRQQVEYFVGYLAQRHVLEYKAERESAAFLFISMLFDGCVASGRSVVEHGVTYLGGVIETFGMVNVADSLTVIKKLVYEEKRFSPEQFLAALDANFVGHEALRHAVKSVPKFGNDDPAADAMLQAVSDHVAGFTRAQADVVGLDYYLIVNINNYANVYMGKECAASADGRLAGEPLANANTPTAGNDRKGITALLNSLAKIKADQHAGYVQNMKFNPQWFRDHRPVLEALLDTYFANGGTQAMITVVSRGDLENAMRQPEKYPNLIVRVGGFSARFVKLSREVQLDLLQRTLY